ncbi:hypothetical protein V6N13_057836 [Hibiscus sabdariffa]
MLHNFIPCLSNLRYRRLSSFSLCLICHSADESIEHFLWSCPFNKQIIEKVGIDLSRLDTTQEWNCRFALFFLQSSPKKRITIAITYWALWFTRNKIYHEGTGKNIFEVVSFIESFIVNLNCSHIVPPNCNRSYIVKWQVPYCGFVKVNFDASFIQDHLTSSSGFLIRDSEEQVLAAGSQLNSNILDPATTEAISALQALKFAADLGFHKIVLGGDSLTVIKKLKHPVEDISLLAAVISEAKTRLGNFHVSYCSFVLRMENQAAHAMAKEGWNVASPSFWIEEVPHTVARIVEYDIHIASVPQQ